MLNILFNLYVTITTIVVYTFLFTTHTIFKLCVSSNNKAAYFYFNFFIFYFTHYFSCILVLPALALRAGDPSSTGAFSHIYKYIGEIMGLEPTVQNSEILAIDRAAVVVQNHQSSLDLLINLIIWNIPKKIIGIAKREIQHVFPFGLINYLTGGCLISRSDRNKALNELKTIGDIMIKNKAKAWFFVEGTRNRDRKKFLPFKKGAFHVAVTAQVPIIPVVSSPFFFLDYEKPSFDKPLVIIRVLEPVPTTGLTKDDIPELMETVRSLMWKEYKNLYKELMPNRPLLS